MGCGESRISHSISAAGWSFKFHVCDVVRVAQTDFVTVAAARGCGREAGGCLRYGNWLAGVTMICAAGRWLSGIALQIGCAGEHVLIRTNLVRTMCWLVVVGCAGAKLPRVGSLVRDDVVSRECVRR